MHDLPDELFKSKSLKLISLHVKPLQKKTYSLWLRLKNNTVLKCFWKESFLKWTQNSENLWSIQEKTVDTL